MPDFGIIQYSRSESRYLFRYDKNARNPRFIDWIKSDKNWIKIGGIAESFIDEFQKQIIINHVC